jgi:hypothetical protein
MFEIQIGIMSKNAPIFPPIFRPDEAKEDHENRRANFIHPAIFENEIGIMSKNAPIFFTNISPRWGK